MTMTEEGAESHPRALLQPKPAAASAPARRPTRPASAAVINSRATPPAVRPHRNGTAGRTLAPLVVSLLVLGAAAGAGLAATGATSSAGPAVPAPAGSGLRPLACTGPLGLNVTATPSSGTVPLAVAFNGTLTGGCPPYEVEWQFGDGAGAHGLNVSHVFESVGVWDVAAEVSDSAGGSYETSTTVTVTGGPGPLSVAVAANPSSGPAPLSVTLWANVSGGNLSTSYSTSWQFGDGGTGSGSIVRHLYAYAGTYSASARVRTSAGAVVTGAVTVAVGASSGGGPANLTLSATPAVVGAPGNVTVVASSNGPAGPYILGVCFGDGSPCVTGPPDWNGSEPVSLVHEYLVPGNFSIQGNLSALNGTLLTGASAAVLVLAGTSLFVETAASPVGGSAPLAASFEATVSGGTPPYSVQWSFGDGTVGSSVPGVPVTHVYGSAGTYTATVRVQDAAGHTNASVLPAIVVRPGGGTVLPAEILGVPTLGVITLLLVAAAGVGVLVGRWSLGRTRERQLRKEGEDLVRELERER